MTVIFARRGPAEESDGGPSTHDVGCGFDDSTGEVASDAKDGITGFLETSFNVGAQEGKFGVLPDLSLMLGEEPTNVWVSKI